MRLGLGIGLQFGHRSGGAAQGPSNTVAPAVTGTAERGELLTCSTGTWTGTGTITYAYQWRRNGSPIAGATNSTYTPVADDDNTNLACIVSATDDEGTRSASSNTVGPVLGAPFLLAAPVLSGTEQVNQTLSVTNGTWQGVATITFGYQWRRNGVDIPGATGATYTLVAADFGAIIDRVETATNSLDSASADSNDTGAIAGLAPTNDVAPSISGNDGLGDTLTRVAGTWSGVPTPTLSGQWRRNGVAISGETGATYTIVAADSGADIDYLETATNPIGSATADSNNLTAQTFAAPTIGAGLSIAGTEEVDETLTATPAAATGNPSPVTTWQWQRSADGLTGWADISGATSSTYTLVSADETNYIRVKQIETNALGSDEAVSAATGEIQAGGATGILDSYTGAAFAFAPDVLIYGTHSVTDNAVGSATNGLTDAYTVRVRRSNDNAVSSFTYTEVSDGTLTTWVGAGNDGFVEAAYDQGTNGNHATQTTAANQPKIVDAGSLVVENGKAALDYNGSTTELTLPAINVSSPCSFFCALNMTGSSVSSPYLLNDYVGGAASETNYLLLGFVNSSNTVRNFGDGVNSGVDVDYKDYSVYTSIIAGVNSVIARNGNTITLDSNATINKTGSTISIGVAKGRQGGTFVDGRMQIIAFYISDQSTNRTVIETAINNEYNIY